MASQQIKEGDYYAVRQEDYDTFLRYARSHGYKPPSDGHYCWGDDGCHWFWTSMGEVRPDCPAHHVADGWEQEDLGLCDDDFVDPSDVWDPSKCRRGRKSLILLL